MVDMNDIDMREVRDHYLMREQIHCRLRGLFEAEDEHEFVRLALGMTDGAGNYSASEHRLGPKILSAKGAERDVFGLADDIENNSVVNRLPGIIEERAISNLKISVGSEIAMMLKPDTHWIGNKRTIWSHLLVKHDMEEDDANEELRLYCAHDDESEMDYSVWRYLYLAVGPDLAILGHMAAEVAQLKGIVPGSLRYLWPDAVATFLFDKYAGR